MPAQLKASVSANQKPAASCGGEWPQITHWYWNRSVKLQLPVQVLLQSLRNESSAGNWLQLNRLFGSSCGIYRCLLFSRDHLLFSPALFPGSLEINCLDCAYIKRDIGHPRVGITSPIFSVPLDEINHSLEGLVFLHRLKSASEHVVQMQISDGWRMLGCCNILKLD